MEEWCGMREEEGKIREKGVGDEEREMRDKGGGVKEVR